MPVPNFIVKLNVSGESMCSHCCQTIRVSPQEPTLEQAQKQHRCGPLSLDMRLRYTRNGQA